MYDPTIGRWISEDPIGFQAADPNLYRYVGNHAPNARDPSGLFQALSLPANSIARPEDVARGFARALAPLAGTPFNVEDMREYAWRVILERLNYSDHELRLVRDALPPLTALDRVSGRLPNQPPDPSWAQELLARAQDEAMERRSREGRQRRQEARLERMRPLRLELAQPPIQEMQELGVGGWFSAAWRGLRWLLRGGRAAAATGNAVAVTGRGMTNPAIMRSFFHGQTLVRTEENIAALRWYLEVARRALARYQQAGYGGPGVATQTQRIQQITQQLARWGLGG